MAVKGGETDVGQFRAMTERDNRRGGGGRKEREKKDREGKREQEQRRRKPFYNIDKYKYK